MNLLCYGNKLYFTWQDNVFNNLVLNHLFRLFPHNLFYPILSMLKLTLTIPISTMFQRLPTVPCDMGLPNMATYFIKKARRFSIVTWLPRQSHMM